MNILDASFDCEMGSSSARISFATQHGYSIVNLNHLEQSIFETSEGGVGCIHLFKSFNNTIMVAISGSGGDHLSSPRKLKIIDIKIRKKVCELTFQSSVLSIQINFKYFFILEQSKIHIIEVNGMKTLKIIPIPMNVSVMAISKSHLSPTLLAYPSSCTAGQITIINVDLAVQLSIVNDLACFDAHITPISRLQFNSSGSLLASASTKGTIIRVFDNTGNKLFEFRRGIQHACITTLQFSPSDYFLAAGSSSGTIHVFPIVSQNNKEEKHEEKPDDVTINQPPEKLKNIFGSMIRAAVISVNKEVRGFSGLSKSTYIARIPNSEKPICTGLINADNNDLRLFVCCSNGCLYRFLVPTSMYLNSNNSNSSSTNSTYSQIDLEHNIVKQAEPIICLLEDERFLLDHDYI